MVASRMEWMRQRSVNVLAVGLKRTFLLLVAICVAGGTASTVRAQCGVLGDPSGQCVDLEFRVPNPVAFVGGTFDVELHVQSVNLFNQAIQAIDTVLNWDPTKIALVGNFDTCMADSTAPTCFTCPPSGGAPGSYNWVTSGFPNDQALDGVNADCGASTFCASFTGAPFNDGDAFYESIKQVFCNGLQAPPANAPPSPDTLLVTTFQFQALVAGPVQISMVKEASCNVRQKVCLRGDVATLNTPCSVDSDCGLRACIGGGSQGLPCSSDFDCPLGVCPVLCSACAADFCCTADQNCDQCSFAETRVLGGINTSIDITGTLGPPALVTISNCQAPSVLVDGSRYLNIVPPAGTDPVAILVEGVSPSVSCVSKYVGSSGILGDVPTYRTPAEWQSAMFDAFNDPTDPTVHARGNELVAGETYAARMDCGPGSPGTNLSDPVQGSLWIFGDTDSNGDRNITDVLRILSGFSGVFHMPSAVCISDADCEMMIGRPVSCDGGRCLWITRENVDIIGVEACGSDRDISIRDALSSLEAFQGLQDSCTIFCP